MEVIVDLDFEPISEIDNVYRNSMNECKYTLNDCQEYRQFLSQNECEYLNHLLAMLRFNKKIDKEEVIIYIHEKYGFLAKNCEDLRYFIYNILIDNDKGIYYRSTI